MVGRIANYKYLIFGALHSYTEIILDFFIELYSRTGSFKRLISWGKVGNILRLQHFHSHLGSASQVSESWPFWYHIDLLILYNNQPSKNLGSWEKASNMFILSFLAVWKKLTSLLELCFSLHLMCHHIQCWFLLEPKTSKGYPEVKTRGLKKKFVMTMQKCKYRIKEIYWNF